VIQAEAGFMDLNGEKDGPPTKMPVALIDVLAGHHLKEGLLLGLLRRERTGKGELVEVSLIQVAVSSLVNQASNWLVANKLPHRQGSAHPNIAPYGESFETSDGRQILLAIGTDRQFADLCSVLAVNELANDERFSTNQKRIENRSTLNGAIGNSIAQFKADDLLARMNSLKIPGGVIQNLKEVFEMPEAREIIIRANNLTGVKNFVAHTGQVHLLPPPHFGGHTDEVLRAAGFSSKELDCLKYARIIA
jgi:crotonobetainyl-CoA:carnitine CoA-transferase CaiB-like acyl-CoA transferase